MAQQKNILILGDSLSAGYGIEVKQSWPVLLEQKLQHLHPDILLTNISISGQTSIEGVAQINELLKTYQPQLLVLELGANDGLRGLSLAEMKRNLGSIIKTTQDHDVDVLLLGMRIPTNYGRRYTQMFHNTYIELAEEYGTHFIPFMLEPLFSQGRNSPEKTTGNQLIQADGLHPTAEAQPMIMAHIWEKLSVLIESL